MGGLSGPEFDEESSGEISSPANEGQGRQESVTMSRQGGGTDKRASREGVPGENKCRQARYLRVPLIRSQASHRCLV